MNHRGPAGAEPAGTLALFLSDTAWTQTSVLDAQAIEACDFDLDAFAQYRRIRILAYSSSVQMLHTILERFAESRIECVLGYSRVVSNVTAADEADFSRQICCHRKVVAPTTDPIVSSGGVAACPHGGARSSVSVRGTV